MDQKLISELVLKYSEDRTLKSLTEILDYFVNEMSSLDDKRESVAYVQLLLYIDKPEILGSVAWLNWANKIGGHKGYEELFLDFKNDVREKALKLAEDLEIDLKK